MQYLFLIVVHGALVGALVDDQDEEDDEAALVGAAVGALVVPWTPVAVAVADQGT